MVETRNYVRRRWGDEYLPSEPRQFTRKVKAAQEAHEAIRPTDVIRTPEAVKPFLNNDQFRLYELIWRRMVASQMSESVTLSTTVDIEARSLGDKVYILRATGSVLKFAGFRTLYLEGVDEADSDEPAEGTLPVLERDDTLKCHGVEPKQHFTKPPPRYTDASLIKTLEEKGIGRPSTYAPIVATIIERNYVEKEEGRFKPTALGITVSDQLVKYFPEIMDVNFTALMEEELDEIASGEREWVPMLNDFFKPFKEKLEYAHEKMPRVKVEEPTDEKCEKCGRPMVIKTGRYGRFLACSGFPECRNAKPLVKRTGVKCPQCGGELVERRSKGKGRTFYGCSNYPTCNFAVNRRPFQEPCPECGGLLVASGRENASCTKCNWKGPLPSREEAAVEV